MGTCAVQIAGDTAAIASTASQMAQSASAQSQTNQERTNIDNTISQLLSKATQKKQQANPYTQEGMKQLQQSGSLAGQEVSSKAEDGEKAAEKIAEKLTEVYKKERAR